MLSHMHRLLIPFLNLLHRNTNRELIGTRIQSYYSFIQRIYLYIHWADFCEIKFKIQTMCKKFCQIKYNKFFGLLWSKQTKYGVKIRFYLSKLAIAMQWRSLFYKLYPFSKSRKISSLPVTVKCFCANLMVRSDFSLFKIIHFMRKWMYLIRVKIKF